MFYTHYKFCWKFILAEFFIIIIGRYGACITSYYMFNCIKGSPSNNLNFREISFITWAALIRGAIAFGLVEKLDDHHFEHKEVIVSSTLVLVITTTIIFGSFTPIVQQCLLPSKSAEDELQEKLVKQREELEDEINDAPGFMMSPAAGRKDIMPSQPVEN